MSSGAGHAAAWAGAALTPPRAHGEPLPSADFKTAPEDFLVEEQLSFVPSGAGPHWLLRVQKTAANTRWVASEIARLAGVPTHDVGYAGLKDRHAISVQWFSVPVPAMSAERWLAVRTPEFGVLEVHGNTRKLKRGALTGNRFRIRLRNVAWSGERLAAKLSAIRNEGVPNYFGPQRFGRDGYNLDRVHAWTQGGQAPRGRTERGFALSAARSLLFNGVLARRVQAGDWARLLPGDLASLEGSGSHFAIGEVDDELRRRLAAFDIHPSGPMWGRGELKTAGRVRDGELETAAEFKEVAALLESQDLDQERRALRCVVHDLEVVTEADSVILCFRLGRGQFATAVLREICELGSGFTAEPDEE